MYHHVIEAAQSKLHNMLFIYSMFLFYKAHDFSVGLLFLEKKNIFVSFPIKWIKN